MIALLLAGCSGDTAKPPTNGAPAPAFQAQTLTGGQVRVPRDYADKVVAIRFWADWCPYCRNEMARLQPVYARLSGRGLEILAVNVAQDRDTVRRFAGPLGLTYPVLLDPEGATARAYGVQALPITWLLDRHGVVRGKIVGEATAEVFERQVRVLLEEGGAAFPSPPAPLMELPSNRLGSQTTPAKSLLVPEGEGRGTHGR